MQTIEQQRHIEEEGRESENRQGQDLGFSRKQDPEFPVDNGRGEISRQESKYLFPVCCKPTSSSPSLLGSPLSSEPPVMGLA